MCLLHLMAMVLFTFQSVDGLQTTSRAFFNIPKKTEKPRLIVSTETDFLLRHRQLI
jgi:hypothetical protein